MTKFSDLSEYKWRKTPFSGGVEVIETKVKIELLAKYDTCSPEELAQKIRGAGLKEAQIELDEADDGFYYGDNPLALFVTGWREATPEEYEAALSAKDEEKRRAQAWKNKQIAALKKSDPDLFKDA